MDDLALPVTASEVPVFTSEMYAQVLAEMEGAITALEPIRQFRDRLNTLFEAHNIVGPVARAKYIAVMLATVKAKHAQLLQTINKAQESEDLTLLLEAITAMPQVEQLDSVMVCLETLLVREVLSIES